jgi:hypothetical protein
MQPSSASQFIVHTYGVSRENAWIESSPCHKQFRALLEFSELMSMCAT